MSNKIIIPDHPKVGDKLYVPSSMEVQHEEDAFSGGICTIKSIHNSMRKKKDYRKYHFIKIEEDGGENQWNWEDLMKQQEQLRKIYKNKRGYKPEKD